MSATVQFDDEASRRAETTYTAPDVVEQRRAIRAALALGHGENALDIGSRLVLLACEMASEVGAVGSVDGSRPAHDRFGTSEASAGPGWTTLSNRG